MAYPNQINCLNCSIPIPAMPEDATASELLCDRCFEIVEAANNQAVISPKLSECGDMLQLRFSPQRGTEYQLFQDTDAETRDVIQFAIAAWGFVLNTDKYRDRWITYREFADAIAAHYAPSPHRDEIIRRMSLL